MMISKIWSALPSKLPNFISWAVLLVAFAGFLDATYLTAKKFTGSTLNCYFFGGCDAVNASPYSNLFGQPLSLYGAVFYLLVLLTTVYYLQTKNSNASKLLVFLTAFGFFFAIYTFSLQAFVIKAWCLYCVISMGTSSVNFALMLTAWWKDYFSRSETGKYKKRAGLSACLRAALLVPWSV